MRILDRDLISEQLPPDAIIGREIIVYRETASTNDIVQHLGESRCAEGIVVFAETQTAGRGRQGRVWHSSEGKGLWFSILLRPPADYFQNGLLTKLTAVALAQELGAKIKEPNDIFIHDKKVAGILMEARNGPNGFCALGIGLNVSQTEDDFADAIQSTATSLQLAGVPIESREALAARILSALNALYVNLPESAAQIQRLYLERLR